MTNETRLGLARIKRSTELSNPMSAKSASPTLVLAESIQRRILVVRGTRVLLDADLARFYGATTFNLNKAIARNPDRFPDDFAFHLPPEEIGNLIFQSGISSGQAVGSSTVEKPGKRHGSRRKPPRR